MTNINAVLTTVIVIVVIIALAIMAMTQVPAHGLAATPGSTHIGSLPTSIPSRQSSCEIYGATDYKIMT